MNIENSCFGFIGLGLIGGSIAKTIKRLYPKAKTVAYNRTQSALNKAVAEGVIDVGCDCVDHRFSVCDYIFLCMPVSYNVEMLSQLSSIARPDCILTDVGSVKSDIHRHVKKLGLETRFIGGHPMAGSDKTGYDHASDHLIENTYYVITPTPLSPQENVDNYYELVQSLGALPIILDYQEHDYMTASVSHVPHVIAAALVHLIKNSDNPRQTMKTIAAGGFRDMTRIASSSPVMWQQICLTNRDNICHVLDDYIQLLTLTRDSIQHGDAEAIYNFFDEAGQYRSSLSSNRGILSPVYELYCDINDESGAIATLAAALAANQISIKNIGIVHNREFENGVLHIEFYDKDALKSAEKLLITMDYVVYKQTS